MFGPLNPFLVRNLWFSDVFRGYRNRVTKPKTNNPEFDQPFCIQADKPIPLFKPFKISEYCTGIYCEITVKFPCLLNPMTLKTVCQQKTVQPDFLSK